MFVTVFIADNRTELGLGNECCGGDPILNYFLAFDCAYSAIFWAALMPVASSRPLNPGDALTSITNGSFSTVIRSTPAISTPTASAALIATSASAWESVCAIPIPPMWILLLHSFGAALRL